MKINFLFCFILFCTPVFSQSENAEGYLSVWFSTQDDPNLKNAKIRNCSYKNNIPESSFAFWVVENKHSTKKIQVCFMVPNKFSTSLNGKREPETSDEEIEIRTINPGQVMFICCSTEKWINTENGDYYVSITKNSEPYIHWAHFVE